MTPQAQSSVTVERPGLANEAGQTAPGIRPVFRTIVVAVDDSTQAAAAAVVAGAIAQRFGAEVVLVNVFWAEREFAPEIGLVGPDPRPACLRAANALLARFRRRIPDEVAVTTLAAEGDAADEVVRTANRLGADLIAMGTHGRGRIAQAVLGSVANAVMRKATCPVLTVAHGAEAAKERGDAARSDVE